MCDELRLRILHLLMGGPLCVCHLVEVLGCDQVRMSKQLKYMKQLGILEGERHAQWMIYRLVDPDCPLLKANIGCLMEEGDPFLADDLRHRQAIMERLRCESVGCAEALLSEQRSCGEVSR